MAYPETDDRPWIHSYPKPPAWLSYALVVVFFLKMHLTYDSAEYRCEPFADSISAESLPAHIFTESDRLRIKQRVVDMFDHGFHNYMEHAFPHDELKPLSASYTDSLGELGGAKISSDTYQGVAMTLIDCLDTLVVLGKYDEFRKAVLYITEHVSFDQNIRVNVFEVNIRVLGGLLSAHLLAKDTAVSHMQAYDDGLLRLALDLGRRLLPAFRSKTGIPYAWVNLRHGLLAHETTNSCTAGVGTLIMEFGMLSYLTGDMSYYDAAYSALISLWHMRDSETGLVGNNLNVETGRWIDDSAGIGAGIDSFYEYLFKAYVLFGNVDFLRMFEQSYDSVMKHLRIGPWYHEASMTSGFPTYVQFNSLQAFWPGLQVLSGLHLEDASHSQRAFFSLWAKYGTLPERFVLGSMSLHSTERYYPLRPELMESTYMLYLASGDPTYLHMGEYMVSSLVNITRVDHGFASVRDVEHRILEDRMPSFFLAETCKYLYLLFDRESFIHRQGNYIFTTEGHLFPINLALHEAFSERNPAKRVPDHRELNVPSEQLPVCSADFRWGDFPRSRRPRFGKSLSASSPKPVKKQAPKLKAEVRDAGFRIEGNDGSLVNIRYLGSPVIEVVYEKGSVRKVFSIHNEKGASHYYITVEQCKLEIAAIGAEFSPPVDDYKKVHSEAVILDNKQGCNPGDYDAVEGRVVIIDRGNCMFQRKAEVAHSLGAAAVVIVNVNDPDTIFFMNGDDSANIVKIPVLMISSNDAAALKKCASHSEPMRLQFNAASSGLEDQSSSVSVFGNHRGFVISTQEWKVLCQRHDDAYTLTYLV